jgi:hypothetical protein
MKPEFASQFSGTAHSEVIDIMERARHVTPYMVIAGYQGEPVFLFPSHHTGFSYLLRAWDQENGWHQRAAHLALRPQYGKGYPLPDELIHGIRVYTDTPGFKRARQGI